MTTFNRRGEPFARPDATKENAPAMTEAQGKTSAANSTRIACLQSIAADLRGNSADTQRDRILRALQALGTLSTVEARRHLDCMHPAQRVLDLRNLGAEIDTMWTLEPTECGRLHRMARYVLRVGVAG